jgi:DNA-binding XRE family transcriptional regulator
MSLDELMQEVSPEPNTGCWIWCRGDHANTYGSTPNGPAHRVVYELTTGIKLGKKYACHRCDNKWCVNPQHIFPGTARDNAMDASRKRHAAAMATVKPRGKPFAENVRTVRLRKAMSQETLAKRLGITRQAVAQIEKGGGLSLERAFHLAEALEVTVNDLVS